MSGMSVLTPVVAPPEPELPEAPRAAAASLLQFGMALPTASDMACQIQNVDERVDICAQEVMASGVTVFRAITEAKSMGFTFVPWDDSWISAYSAPVLVGMLRARGFVIYKLAGVGRVISWAEYVSPEENYLERLHNAIGIDVHGYAIEDTPEPNHAPRVAQTTATPRRRPASAVRAPAALPTPTPAAPGVKRPLSSTRPAAPSSIYNQTE